MLDRLLDEKEPFGPVVMTSFLCCLKFLVHKHFGPAIFINEVIGSGPPVPPNLSGSRIVSQILSVICDDNTDHAASHYGVLQILWGDGEPPDANVHVYDSLQFAKSRYRRSINDVFSKCKVSQVVHGNERKKISGSQKRSTGGFATHTTRITYRQIKRANPRVCGKTTS
jgi:hypothetical protein